MGHLFLGKKLKKKKKKKRILALAGVTQWIGRRPVNQKVAHSALDWGARLGHQPGPQLGVCKRQPVNVSLFLYQSTSIHIIKRNVRVY